MASEKASPRRRAQHEEGRAVRKRSDGTREGLITARVPLAIARETKMLAIEQDRAVRYVVADALRAYIASVDAANARRTETAETAAG